MVTIVEPVPVLATVTTEQTDNQPEPQGTIAASTAVIEKDIVHHLMRKEMKQKKRQLNEDNRTVMGKRLVVNRVENVSSSIAGSNSSGFDMYRNSRRREQDRLDGIEYQQREEEEREKLLSKVIQNKREADERTRKNAERRKLKKLKKRQGKKEGDRSGEAVGGESGNESQNSKTSDDIA
jgi:hypothetical protein